MSQITTTFRFFTMHITLSLLLKTLIRPVYTVPDPHTHDIKLNSFKTNVALKFVMILENLITLR